MKTDFQCIWALLYPEQMIRISIESENADLAGADLSGPYVKKIVQMLRKDATSGKIKPPNLNEKRPYVIFQESRRELAFNAAARSVSGLTDDFQGYKHEAKPHATHNCLITKDAALEMQTPLLDLFQIRVLVLEAYIQKRDLCYLEPRESAEKLFAALKQISKTHQVKVA
jgi:hypothetical protein